MDMRLPVQIHPDLRTIVHVTAEFQARDPVDLVVEALERYLADDTLETTPDMDADWAQWEPDESAREYDKSLSSDLSARLVQRAKRDGVHHLQVIDRALRHYYNALFG